jgi:hypothetical protein
VSELQGTFGLDVDRMVPGSLRLEDDGSFVLELYDFIFQPEQLDMSEPNVVTYSGDAAKVVADFVPRDIVGTLEDGRPVTLFRALMEGPSFLTSAISQTFRGSMSLMGTHLRSEHDDVEGIRWTWYLPAELNFETEGPPNEVVGPIPGVLEAWSLDRGKGFQFTAEQTVSLQRMRNQVQLSSGQLLGLWSAQKVPGVVHTEVKVGGDWHVLAVRGDEPAPLGRSTFLPVQELSQSMFAAWITLGQKVDPYHFILNGLTNTLQLDAQALSTGLEGLHRRLFEDDVRFEGVPARAVKRAAREARYKGVEALRLAGFEDEQYAHTVFAETLRHLNQVTYQDRAVELLRPVHDIVPSLFGPDLSKWVEMVKKIRNQQSHQWVEDFDESSITIYYVVVESCRWALVLRILLQLQPEYDFLSRLARSDRFSFALANIDREELWPGFSALAEFRARVYRHFQSSTP